jgi:hypothetical protein
MPAIPRRNQVTCHYCYDVIDMDAETTYQRVQGWAKNRGGRGGTNALALRQTQLYWACHMCIDKRTAGLASDSWEQIDLFAE